MRRVFFSVCVFMLAITTVVLGIVADDFSSSGGVSQGPNPPDDCSSSFSGEQWIDTDTGILYMCDTSNGRNKWLSVTELHLNGSGDTVPCGSNNNPNDSQCTQAIGRASANDMGYLLERNVTIVGGAFHSNSSCGNGSGVDLEVANGANAGVAYLGDILTGCTDANGCSATGLNIDVNAGDAIRARLDNNCAVGANNVTNWESDIVMRYRHD